MSLMQKPTPEEEKNFERWLLCPNWDDHDFRVKISTLVLLTVVAV
jgi:hypothetical protein